MQKLMVLFKAESRWQLVVIFIVFAVTGSVAVIVRAGFGFFYDKQRKPLLGFWPLVSYHLPNLSVVTDHNWYVSRTVSLLLGV